MAILEVRLNSSLRRCAFQLTSSVDAETSLSATSLSPNPRRSWAAWSLTLPAAAPEFKRDHGGNGLVRDHAAGRRLCLSRAPPPGTRHFSESASATPLSSAASTGREPLCIAESHPNRPTRSPGQNANGIAHYVSKFTRPVPQEMLDEFEYTAHERGDRQRNAPPCCCGR